MGEKNPIINGISRVIHYNWGYNGYNPLTKWDEPPSGKRLHDELEHHHADHAINGSINDLDWAIFSLAPEGKQCV